MHHERNIIGRYQRTSVKRKSYYARGYASLKAWRGRGRPSESFYRIRVSAVIVSEYVFTHRQRFFKEVT